MKNTKFIGTGVAVVTPFDREGNFDEKALEKILNNMIFGGVEYIVMMGTTGESVTLSKEEKAEIIAFVKETNDGRVPMVLGIGGNNTREIIEQIKHTDFEGVAAILSVSPYYNKPSQEGIYQHYVAIADAALVPVILYNVPGRTGSNISAETTLRLSAHPNIIGIKEASGNMEQCMRILKDRPEDFLVISGDDALTLPFLGMGMDGVISVLANALPKEFSDMTRAGLRSDYEGARELHYKIFNLIQLIYAEGSPSGIKALLEMKGLCRNVVRLPLFKISDMLYKRIKEEIE